MHPFGKQFGGYLAYVVDFGHGDNRIAAKMRVYDYGLRISVADHSQSLTSRESVQLVLELGTEIISLQTVNGPVEPRLGVEGHKAGTFRSQMGMIVSAVEEIVDARCL